MYIKGTCSLCRDVGWLLDAKDKAGVVTLEIYPCLIPYCPHSGKPIELMSIEQMGFTKPIMHPATGVIMSVSRRG